MRVGAVITRALVLTGTSLVLAACTTVVQGSAVITDGRPAVDTAQLDVGDYPTRPLPPLGTAGTMQTGVIVEAQRMANFVVGPWEVDPSLTSGYAMVAQVVVEPRELTLIGPGDMASAASRNGFINGFVSARRSPGRTTLRNAVLRFAVPPAAAAGAADLAQAALQEPLRGAQPQPVTIPGHPDARASSYTLFDVDTRRPWTAVRAFISHGQYVFTQLAESLGGPDPAVALIANTLGFQGPVIDQFQSTDPALFAEIPLDPTGLLARTLPLPARERTVMQNARYGKRGALHLQNDPARSSALFDKTAMELAAMAKTTVYTTIDAEAASRIVDEFAAEVQARGGRSVDAVEFLPGSRCVEHSDGVYVYCVASADRYAIEAQSRGAADARQQVAAQYLLLVAP